MQAISQMGSREIPQDLRDGEVALGEGDQFVF
jgi:hypothetical protein